MSISTQTPPPTVAKPVQNYTSANVFLPLRLFLGVSFIAAGLDKLTDPQFFNASSSGYIGKQLAGFAQQSPVGGFLTNVAVPNATLFGVMVLAGEMAIGLGTLVGLLSRVAAFFGFILSITLWLTSSWAVTPFFLGSDIPYAIGWLTLALAPAHPVLSLDGWLRNRGTQASSPGLAAFQNEPAVTGPVARRQFVTVAGATVLAGAVTGVAWIKGLSKNNNAATTTPTTNPATTTQTPATGDTTAGSGAGTGTTSGPVLASLSSLAAGSSQKITIPGSGDPAILIREADGSVKAFSSVCTHQGCEVGYDQAQTSLVCPCHNSQFNIQNGAPTQGPATTPLQNYGVKIEGNNIVYVQS